MARAFLVGLIATVVAVLAYWFTVWLDIGGSGGAVGALLAVVAGIVLGITPDRSPLGRFLAFLIGLPLGILAIILGGLGAIGWIIMTLLFTIVSFLTGGRLPIWAMLLAGGTMGAIYAPQIPTAWLIATDYPTTLFVALAASAAGFLVVIAVELFGLGQTDEDIARAKGAAA